MMYQNTKTPDSTSTSLAVQSCSKGIQKNELMAKISTLCTNDSNDVYKIGPVSMKVFGWTRFFVLQNPIVDQDESSASADVLFCSNGFEQHRGQCKSHFLQPKPFWDSWNREVWDLEGTKYLLLFCV
jgi:hypothetical protein